EKAPHVRVGIVQGNISQDEKWTPDKKKATLDIYQELTDSIIAKERPVLLIWPETAIPFFPNNDPLFTRITEMVKNRNVWLFTGAPYFSIMNGEQNTDRHTLSYYNSALLINPAGKVSGRYDKQHLVPFGEYVPLQQFLSFLEPLVESVGNFSSGRSGEPLSVGPVKLGTLICYESIFPELARKTVASGANLLVNLTNDAWYGRSSAPYQSFAMSVLRSVETRRSLARAANTGISGFITPLGKVVEQSELFEPAAFSAEIPLYDKQTVYIVFGRFFGPLCLVFVPFLFILRRKKS
ncbi:MAG: apolipoprotein N-acyltransferase, partial [Desulfobulbales bacterium]